MSPRQDPLGSWRLAFVEDPVAMWALLAAARACMAAVCNDHDPAECDCPAQMMTPLEFSQWVELEVHMAERTPVRLDQRENRKAGQRVRRSLEMAAG